MKRVFIVTLGFVILSAMSIAASAQTRPAPQPTPATPITAAAVPASKIALVDTQMFGDEKLGIKHYVNAVKIVQTQLQPRAAEIRGLENQLKTLADEIAKLRANSVVGPETIKAKQAEGERLQRDYTYKQDQFNADYEKRYTEVVGPVSTSIGKALDEYAAAHGITMVLDISKLLPAVLTVNPNMDITQTFMADYNNKNP